MVLLKVNRTSCVEVTLVTTHVGSRGKVTHNQRLNLEVDIECTR